MNDGTLVVASSGLRSEHICPFGKTVLNVSRDGGRTWSPPRVISDTPLDDRDAGVVSLGGQRLLVTWFTTDTRRNVGEQWVRDWVGDEEIATWQPALERMTNEAARQWPGSWVMRSDDGGETWDAPVSAPHGPICLRSGALLYLGKPYGAWDDMNLAAITAAISHNAGDSWQTLGQVPVHPGADPANYHEPHSVELPSGRPIGMMRVEMHSEKALPPDVLNFSIMQTESEDGGHTWVVALALAMKAASRICPAVLFSRAQTPPRRSSPRRLADAPGAS